MTDFMRDQVLVLKAAELMKEGRTVTQAAQGALAFVQKLDVDGTVDVEWTAYVKKYPGMGGL